MDTNGLQKLTSRPLDMHHNAVSSANERLAWAALFVTTALFSALIWPTTAEACEPGYCIDYVVPEDGADQIPVDSHIWVFYTRPPSEFADPQIELLDEETGERIDIDIKPYPRGNENDELRRRLAVVQPRQNLDKTRTYRLSLDGRDACGVSDVVFTTGGETAGASPQLEGPLSGSVTCDSGPESTDSCNDQSRYPVYRFSISTPTSTSNTVAHELLHDGEVVAVEEQTPVTVNMLPENTDAEECFQLRAKNIAGTGDEADETVCVDTTTVECSTDGDADAGNADTGMDTGLSDVGPDTGHSDTGTVSDAAASDAASADSISRVDSSPRDTTPDETAADGCNCRGAGDGSPVGATAPLLLAGLLVFRIRLERE